MGIEYNHKMIVLNCPPGIGYSQLTYVGRCKKAKTRGGNLIYQIFKATDGREYAFNEGRRFRAALNGRKLTEGAIYDLRFS